MEAFERSPQAKVSNEGSDRLPLDDRVPPSWIIPDSSRSKLSTSVQQSQLRRLCCLAVKRGCIPGAQALMSAAQEVIGEVDRAVPRVQQGENAKIGRFDLELAAGQ